MTDKPTVGRIEFGPVPTEAERVAMKAQAFPEILRRHDDLVEEVARLRALLAEARAALAPFAEIRTSRDWFQTAEKLFDITRSDLARARAFMKDSEDG